MRRLITFIIESIFIVSIVFAQDSGRVGINTTNPQNIFHIDPLGNTNGSTGAQDDIVVGPNGMGIGKLNPTKSLDISGNALFAGNDTIYGRVNVDNVIVNDTLRVGGLSLENLHSKLDIVVKEPRKGFRFDNGSQTLNNEPNLTDMIPVMTIENDTMTWRNLRAVTKIKSVPLSLDRQINNSNASGINITDGEMELEPGYWLVCAGFAAHFPQKTGTRIGWYVYATLRESPYGPDETLAMNGAPSETLQTSAGVSTPQLVYLLHVKQYSRKYRIMASTSLGSGGTYPYKTTSIYGNAYFYAIKLE